jgi:Mrp family chromosome partitioning ATPase
MSDDKSSCESCSSQDCSAKTKTQNETDKDFAERQELARRMCRIKHKLFVISGKGGVGKSSVAANLAISLAKLDRKIGVLDIDLHGPSIPRLFGLEGANITAVDDAIHPVLTEQGVRVMSIGFMLRSQDDAVIWRGPLKHGVIKQFLKDVEWGDLDYLIIDSPPGTGDEPLSVAQLIDDADGAVIVTTPQAVAISDVRKSISFARQVNVPVLGVIENMSGFICPECGARTDLFGSGGGKKMAVEMGVPFLGSIPIDPGIVPAGDSGELPAYLSGGSPGAAAFADIVKRLVATVEGE